MVTLYYTMPTTPEPSEEPESTQNSAHAFSKRDSLPASRAHLPHVMAVALCLDSGCLVYFSDKRPY